jgi:hypothetical protein
MFLFFSRQAAVYFLEIPMTSGAPITPQIYVDSGRGFNEADASMALVLPSARPQTARFRLPLGKIYTLRFSPMRTAGVVSVGRPVIRCAADAAMGLRFVRRQFNLGSILPETGIKQLTREGKDALRIETLPDAEAGEPSCLLDIGAQPLRLQANRLALWRSFALAALAWSAIVGLLFWRRRILLGWLLAPRRSDALFAPPATATGAPVAAPRWERRAIGAMLVLSAVVQINAILHHGVIGQDWKNNYTLSKEMSADLNSVLSFSDTNPPAYYFIAALIIRLTGGVHEVEVIGLLNMLLNLGALWLLHRLALRLIVGQPALRVGLMALVTFVPVRLIHSVVLAGDALTLAPMFGLALLLIRLLEEPRPNQRMFLALAASLTLIAGVLIKFTFMSALVATALVFAQAFRRGTWRGREAIVLCALVILPPAMLAFEQVSRHDRFGSLILGVPLALPASMSPASIVFLRPADRRLLDAPVYNETSALPQEVRDATERLKYELLLQDRYSYLALTHLATFTDLLNIFQYDPSDEPFGKRDARNQRLMALAVKTALPITLLCLAAGAALTVGFLLFGVFAPARSRADAEAVLLLALGWLGNIIVFLPRVDAAYWGGYWLPRLILPALLLLFLLTFFLLDRLLKGAVGRVAAWALLVGVVCQSALHVAFLWPWGKM